MVLRYYSGLGFGVPGLGFGVPGLGFGFGLRVSAFGGVSQSGPCKCPRPSTLNP